MTDKKPTLHHMDHSQSQRILWLIEELEIPYNLELHFRQSSGALKGRAPAELKETHPLGKAPQLETADGRVIAESSAIAAYLIATYDTSKKFQGDDAKNDWIRNESLTSFAGTSLGSISILKLFLDILTAQMPFFIRPLVAMFTGGVHRMFVGPEFQKMMTYLESELGEQEYFMGKEPGEADFILSWPIDMIAQRKWIDLGEFPKLVAWRERCQEREAWKRCLTKGNGYNLTSFG